MARHRAASSARLRHPLAAGPGALLAGAAVVALAVACGAPVVAPDAGERAAILALGPWPPAPLHDAGNPASANPDGIALGEALFHSPRLSPTGLRCASCHEPWKRFADGRPLAQGVAAGSRNTPSLLDAGRHRHFGWDGARDALWRQSLRPLQDTREMPARDTDVANLLRGDTVLAARYARVFGARPGADDARVTRDVALALSAYVETLATPRTTFDDWRDRLAAWPGAGEPPLTAAARRGLSLFVGRAGCVSCHAGPMLSDDALHASRVHMSAGNALRTPGLRGVAATGPWFHDGSASRLCDAVRPHAIDPGSVAVSLADDERRDLVAFLMTLTRDPPDDAAASC